ncbi:TIGR02099 family protein [Lysobacter ciconiae]|uniref:TIGR02099 family protein n=1 Tax=Novilysobacter ciconiae TaxID=2781022 RepID=A0A7S6ZRN1_9GAMM|nr:YhdP family protein [Lysobacter ciconiae]QOW18905.1 TIGR02099 family protein [Lysobacter ciconiae]
MPTPLRRRLRLARRGVGYTVGIVLVLLALVIAVASQLLPLVERHPDRVAAWLGERVGRPVAFDRLQTGWTRRGPLLQLHNLRLGEGADVFDVGDAEMLLSIYAGLWPGVPLSELRLRGLELVLERSPDGRWQVRGLPGQREADGDPFHSLEGLGELQVSDGALTVLAPDLGLDLNVPRIDLRLRVQGDRVRAGLRAWPEELSSATPRDNRDDGRPAPVVAMLDFHRHGGAGRAYVGIDRAELQPLASVLDLHGITLQTGDGRARAWADLEDKRLVGVKLETTLERVVLAGSTIAPVPGAAGQIPLQVIDLLESRVIWRRTDGGWQLDAPLLHLQTQGEDHRFGPLTLAAGRQYGLVAEHIDLQPLASLAVLSNQLPGPLRHWLLHARPHGSLSGVDLQGRRDGGMQGAVRIDGLGFAPLGNAPGINGLAADVRGDAEGFSAQLDPSAAMSFDWPRGFGVPHVVHLTGNVAGWRGPDGWQAGTSALRIQGPDFGANVRGGLGWNGDGGRPRIDLAATVDETRLPVAKGFWVRHLMPEALLHWLDTALVDGIVRDGRAIVSGDLDDWPFDDHTGRFEASAHITDATVAFQPDWPAATGLDLQASFIGNGLDISGHGTLAGIAIPSVKASVDHYDHGTLAIQAKGSSDVSRLLGLLRASPLQQLNPETFASIKGSGPAEVDFAMALPMVEHGALAIDGNVRLAGARLADPRWGLAFEQVRGPVTYTQNGFRADRLDVQMGGRPGKLSLRSGKDAVRDSGNVLEADLQAQFGADTLLARAPELGWLAPYMHGRSSWTVGVLVPAAGTGSGGAARLKLQSDLVGTALTLPAPLAKPAGQRLAATVETALPLEQGEVQVVLGDVLALRARSSGQRTGIRAALGTATLPAPAPASGLIASGRARSLDAIGWVGLARAGAGDGSGAGVPLGQIDIRTDRLQLFGGEFGDARVRVSPGAGGALLVQAEGPRLQGRLQVPESSTAPVSGRFERVHWRLPTKAAGAPKPAPHVATATVDEDIDPARIPPLALDIDDLRLDDAVLGRASLRTRATAAGLQIEHFSAQRPGQRIDVRGSWTGRGRVARTRFEVDLASTDFGRLLAGLGHVGRLDGGEGRMSLAAEWPGGPMQFELVKVSGNLKGEVRDGRLLDVEPGAGRVLGLLSIAELPRRLMLDFRDFFSKGFAFNEAKGDIRFAGGMASSDDLRIEGPAARINIRGEADLRAETFNQTIEVLPRSGNLLTVAGALAGGPVGAAIGAAANAVLRKPLGQIGAKTYRVSGPWKDPHVDVVSREPERNGQARPAASAAGPGNASSPAPPPETGTRQNSTGTSAQAPARPAVEPPPESPARPPAG